MNSLPSECNGPRRFVVVEEDGRFAVRDVGQGHKWFWVTANSRETAEEACGRLNGDLELERDCEGNGYELAKLGYRGRDALLLLNALYGLSTADAVTALEAAKRSKTAEQIAAAVRAIAEVAP